MGDLLRCSKELGFDSVAAKMSLDQAAKLEIPGYPALEIDSFCGPCTKSGRQKTARYSGLQTPQTERLPSRRKTLPTVSYRKTARVSPLFHIPPPNSISLPNPRMKTAMM